MELVRDPAALERRFALLRLREAMPFLDRYPWSLVRWSKGEHLCRCGEPVHHLIVLLDGRVSVSITTPHGRTHTITYCAPGELICGDVEAALGSTLATADLRAYDKEIFCAALDLRKHRAALMDDVDFLRFALCRVSREMVKDSVYATNNLLFRLAPRMAAFLLDQAPDGLFSVPLTHAAHLLGGSYRQISRVMKTFREQGLVERTDQGWRIVNRAELARQATDIEEPEIL